MGLNIQYAVLGYFIILGQNGSNDHKTGVLGRSGDTPPGRESPTMSGRVGRSAPRNPVPPKFGRTGSLSEGPGV